MERKTMKRNKHLLFIYGVVLVFFVWSLPLFAEKDPLAGVNRIRILESIIGNSHLYFDKKKDNEVRMKYYPELAGKLQSAIEAEGSRAYKGMANPGLCKMMPAVIKDGAMNAIHSISKGNNDAARFMSNMDAMFFAIGSDIKIDNPGIEGVPMDFSSAMATSSYSETMRSMMYITDMTLGAGIGNNSKLRKMKNLLDDFSSCSNQGSVERVEPMGYLIDSCQKRCNADPFWASYGCK